MTDAPDPYTRWCADRGVTHAHCPLACEHPQPFGAILAGESAVRLVCGRCWHADGVLTEMVPCTAEVCGE